VGGDEFLALIESVETRGRVDAVAQQLKAAVEREKIPGSAGGAMSISYGIAVFPGDGLSAHDVVREADLAMYHDKRRLAAQVR
jgi:diguanylate cyclase (GGDEF)-like protein